ncbi:hypothetical protein, partial [Pseudomonas sp. K5002]|uniref:hypothetical protein n=1 Tax=Pseudomonas sp. K5002 TaxID=2738828 RepID=UPI001C4A8E99
VLRGPVQGHFGAHGLRQPQQQSQAAARAPPSPPAQHRNTSDIAYKTVILRPVYEPDVTVPAKKTSR